MLLPLCDDDRRLAARLYVALRVECGCCTFYRGVVLGVIVASLALGAAIAISAMVL